MSTPISGFTILRHLRTVSLLFVLLGLYACASSPDAESTAATESTDTAGNTDASKSDSAKKSESTDEVAFVPPEPATEPVAQVEKTKAVSIDVSCKNEPYSKYEKQARNSIAKGLSATTAGTYGVGFRDLKEHKRWSKTHGKLFKAVNKACSALSKCAKKNPKDKSKQCAEQADSFAQWQALSEQFAKKAKQVETTQPEKICSFTPSLDDAASCFHALGNNVDKACTGSACKEVSDCWRGIGFLDYAINQASSACGFAHQKLSECRGYTTAMQRRESKFKRCQKMQDSLSVQIIPVL